MSPPATPKAVTFAEELHLDIKLFSLHPISPPAYCPVADVTTVPLTSQEVMVEPTAFPTNPPVLLPPLIITSVNIMFLIVA